MALRLKVGIIVNNEEKRYDVVRADNGNVIDWVYAKNTTSAIMRELEYIEHLYHVYIVNKESLRLHLVRGLHPELAWRPGRRGVLRGLRETWWEMGNIARTIEERRKGQRRY